MNNSNSRPCPTATVLATNKVLSRAEKPMSQNKGTSSILHLEFLFPSSSLSTWVCFGDPQCQISSLRLSSGMSRGVPAHQHRTKLRQQQFLAVSCRVLVLLPLDKHLCLSSYIRALQHHLHLWRSAWGTWLPPGVTETVESGFSHNSTWHKPTLQEDIPFPCPRVVLCQLLSHWTCGMSELIQAKTQRLASFPNVLVTS